MQVPRDAIDPSEIDQEEEECEPIVRVKLANMEKLPCQVDGRRREAQEMVCALAMGEDVGGSTWGYASCSQGQAHLFHCVKHVFCEEIQKMDGLPVNAPDQPPVSLYMADFGCATGSNTISTVSTIFEAIKRRYAMDDSVKTAMPEVMAFFADLPGNDFNSLFRLLRPSSCPADEAPDKTADGFFVAGVPGSFHNRLFPSNMLHVGTSILALHWLSQVPPPVRDRNSPAFNRGRIWLAGANSQTVTEYAHQFKKDFTRFLICRAQEVAAGGLLLLLLPGRPENCQREVGPLKFFEETWNVLVKEGEIDAEDRDEFNVPVYEPTMEEVKESIQDANAHCLTSDRFEIKRMEYFGDLPFFPPELTEKCKSDPCSFGKIWCNVMRSMLNNLVKMQLGLPLTNLLFSRLAEMITERANEAFCKAEISLIALVLVCK